ncbi:MAG: ABC transporter substrate-binding protein [Devosia sp.]
MVVVSYPSRLLSVLGSVVLSMSLVTAGVAETGVTAAAGVKECGGYPLPVFPDLVPLAAAEGTATVASEFGDVEIPTAPAAALGMYTTDVDMLIWLGFPLATSQPIRGLNGYETFPCFFPVEPLTGIATFGNFPDYNYEQILLAEPDFILNGLGYDAAVNERLPEIAPTYSVNAFDGRSWQEHFKETAEALGRLDRYEAWLDIYQARLAEVRQAIKHNADMVVSPLGYWEGTFNASCYAGVECTVFRDLGLTIFEGALKDDGEGVEIGSEAVSQLDGLDYVFTIVAAGEQGLVEHRALMIEAAKNPLWAQLDFVREQHIIPFDMEMVYGSPSGQLAFLEVVAKALSN